MGHQLYFYMTPKDRGEFLNFVQKLAPTLVALRDSDVSETQPANSSEIDSGGTLVLWKRTSDSRLVRKWVPDPGYFRVDTLKEPALEYMSSFPSLWKEEPALGQGRLFGNFEPYLDKPADFMKWYEVLAGWIRKHYSKNKKVMGGYVGPDAQEFANQGGCLLPSFVPPETPEWDLKIRGHSGFTSHRK